MDFTWQLYIYYSGLNENSPHRFMSLNTWSQIDETVREELESMAL